MPIFTERCRAKGMGPDAAMNSQSERPAQSAGLSKGVSHWCEEESCARGRLRLPSPCNYKYSNNLRKDCEEGMNKM